MKSTIFTGKYHQNGGFSMAMLVYRGVTLYDIFSEANNVGNLKQHCRMKPGSLLEFCGPATNLQNSGHVRPDRLWGFANAANALFETEFHTDFSRVVNQSTQKHLKKHEALLKHAFQSRLFQTLWGRILCIKNHFLGWCV